VAKGKASKCEVNKQEYRYDMSNYLNKPHSTIINARASAIDPQLSSKFVQEPPNVKQLLKLINQTGDHTTTPKTINVSDLIASWQTDSDDFELFDRKQLVAAVPLKLESLGDRKSLRDKYESIFSDLTRDLVETKPATFDVSPSESLSSMIVNETIEPVLVEVAGNKKETNLLQLFEDKDEQNDDDDDDDLLLFNQAALIEKKLDNKKASSSSTLQNVENIAAPLLLSKPLLNVKNTEIKAINQSTSTPIRSILKNRDQNLNNPLCSPVDHKMTPKNAKAEISLVGMSQALNLINKSTIEAAAAAATVANLIQTSPGDTLRSERFNMKSTLLDIFMNDDDDDNDDQDEQMNDQMMMVDLMQYENSIQMLESFSSAASNKSASTNRSRKLVFDGTATTTAASVETRDESIILEDVVYAGKRGGKGKNVSFRPTPPTRQNNNNVDVKELTDEESFYFKKKVIFPI
jgi:hypothetical protein